MALTRTADIMTKTDTGTETATMAGTVTVKSATSTAVP
jgi:hypothetical protein